MLLNFSFVFLVVFLMLFRRLILYRVNSIHNNNKSSTVFFPILKLFLSFFLLPSFVRKLKFNNNNRNSNDIDLNLGLVYIIF